MQKLFMFAAVIVTFMAGYIVTGLVDAFGIIVTWLATALIRQVLSRVIEKDGRRLLQRAYEPKVQDVEVEVVPRDGFRIEA